MQSPTIPQQPTPYPMTHMTGSPIANLGYHYPAQPSPLGASYAQQPIPTAAYSNYPQGSAPIAGGSFVGTKSLE